MGIWRNRLRRSWMCVLSLIISLSLQGGCGTMQNGQVETTAVVKFPEKPITVIVPFSAGGSLDIIARAMEKKSLQYLGQPMVVINKPGAGSSIGLNELASSGPDGYTIGITSPEMILNPLYSTTKYNYVTALAPVAQIIEGAMVLAVRADQPWQELPDLIQYAKQHPGELKFGHIGIGSLPHIMSETFAQQADIEIGQVPFRGASEAVAALLGGHIQVVALNPIAISEFIKSGQIRALVVSGKLRTNDPTLTKIPTFHEVGYNLTFYNWYDVAIPKEVPLNIKTKLAEGIRGIIHDPEFKRDMDNLGMPIVYLNPQDTGASWIDEHQKYNKILRETGILDQIKEQKK